MDATLAVIFAGLLATAAMTVALYTIHVSGLANADMLRAVGSLVTRRDNRQSSFNIGLVIHLVVGVLFAFLYLAVWSLWDLSSAWQYVVLGAVFGFAHGLAVSIMLINLVAEHHPLARFRRVGFGVAMTHLGAHIVYGIVLGGAIYFLNARYQTLDRIAEVTHPLVQRAESRSLGH